MRALEEEYRSIAPLYVVVTCIYSGTWELGTPKGPFQTVLNSEVVFISQVYFYVMNRPWD